MQGLLRAQAGLRHADGREAGAAFFIVIVTRLPQLALGVVYCGLPVLAIIVLIFGTKKLRNLGTDLGGAVKGFKDGMKSESDKSADGEQTAQAKGEIPPKTGATYEAEVKKEAAKS